jgi:hypothetical protein
MVIEMGASAAAGFAVKARPAGRRCLVVYRNSALGKTMYVL